jgi:hypothetical protein
MAKRRQAMMVMVSYPLVKLTQLWKITIFDGKSTILTGPFSSALFACLPEGNYQETVKQLS